MSLAYHPRAIDVIIFRYIHVAIATAWTWDAIISFSSEVDALGIFQGKLVPVIFVYLLSRLLTLLIAVGEVVIVLAPLGPRYCNVLVHIISSLATATTCLGTYLFLVRVKSTFFQSKPAQYMFSLWWFLAVVAVVATVPFSFSGTSIMENDLCAISRAGRLEAVGCLTVASFDCAVFVSISFRVISLDGQCMGRWAMVKAFITGSKAGPISKALLRTGQLYYFPITVLLIFLLIFEFSSFVPEEFSPQCQAATYLAIGVFYNIMACRVFRLLRLVGPSNMSTMTAELPMSNLRFRPVTARDECTSYQE